MEQKKTELLIEMANKKMMKEIGQLRLQLQQLNQDVHALKTLTNAPQQIQAPQQEVQQKIEPKTETTAESRSGNYTSDDVSIEKIFYFGKK